MVHRYTTSNIQMKGKPSAQGVSYTRVRVRMRTAN